MEVFSAISGETLAFWDVDEIEGKSAKAMKQLLRIQLGISRFRQQFLLQDSSRAIPDDELLAALPAMKIQLVLLEFEQTEGGRAVQEMISACRSNRADELEHLLQLPRNPDLRDEAGNRPLHHAAEIGHLKSVLMKAGVHNKNQGHKQRMVSPLRLLEAI
eukprot:Skav217494  [mRNA]  locus=scaffold2951:35917:36746:- [translate_table: standard]